ncbi:hypothetical protein SeMB42_g02005 [Synchytrium endobioticum]|uniref:Alpha N-terminal protein methyltransferase 1 n=1 Tax=Synchytrium endobioticum TaxID=286115 RepID=A0A507D048_9FUNG|nr:hypothetical protein SeLEV6574_g04297 [Synchytrium endobioticum]TPX51218.1 hypothetical protein SeMB42_g02005 [Synchytrium endobioticum]
MTASSEGPPKPKDPRHHAASWYMDAASYWDGVDATVDGMLGGFANLTEIDCRGSLKFIEEYVKPTKALPGRAALPPRIPSSLACDCGAGIGRVSKNFLLKIFNKVDLVEQNPKFLEKGKRMFDADGISERVDRFIAVGLQDFSPDEGRYDLIWCQWVLGHLTDDDFIDFFKRCKNGLKPGGIIGVKENTTEASDYEVDDTDSSVTRSDEKFKELFEKAGLQILKEAKQNGFPSCLYPVRMYMLEASE